MPNIFNKKSVYLFLRLHSVAYHLELSIITNHGYQGHNRPTAHNTSMMQPSQ